MEISCSFEKIEQWYPFMNDGGTKKFGRYSTSNLAVKGLGFDKWALVANIILDKSLEEYASQGLTEEQVVEACLEHLNKPPTRRSRKPKYGKLTCHYFNVLEETKISVSLLTTERNSKHFWGRGIKNKPARKISKRGRPRKKR